MLDSFRRRDPPRSLTARPESPYAELREALNTAQPAAPAAKHGSAKTDAQKMPPEHTQASSGDGSMSKLIVGPEIKLKGAAITDCDTLVVEGRVEASMNSRVIQIAECGVFVGKVGIDTADIRGRFDGELTAHKELVIRSTGRVSGTIRYGKLLVEEGGELCGDVAATAAGAPSSLDVPGASRKAAGANAALDVPPAGAAGHTEGDKPSGTAHRQPAA